MKNGQVDTFDDDPVAHTRVENVPRAADDLPEDPLGGYNAGDVEDTRTSADRELDALLMEG